MNPGTTSLQLRDIHLPDPVSWWPPAPGWWFLLLLFAGLMFALPYILKKLKHKPINKIALDEFNKIQQQYAAHQDTKLLLQQISALLRRTCMSFAGRQQSASTIGNAWISQLNQLSEENFFNDEISAWLLTAPYQKQTAINVEELLNVCHSWIKALPGGVKQ